MFGIGAAVIACVLLLRRHSFARPATILGAGLVALGFVEHHLIPASFGNNNPYFTFDDGNRADWFRWSTVLVLVALGAWTSLRWSDVRHQARAT